ncbi:MAG: HlyD family efflux transporter periplasmic adaptor subunit [Rhodobacter sp.]|uniref:HlyD family secretion protein n=1 Tax=Pararhodobacter sp. TaxID=2127056 RepID=UPI002C227EE7|nr:HlyD family efflux transporter periplasmic adaptor subunit [Pararhodobacter sp.]MCC0074345.1 HlyD family efflux transporter periplasmic adaptor subunit [Rhodobacter sp.]HPD93495.1 HlyD family efflux transporter periplasmic adaptor subunit [Pararhodobacter sp.]
MSFLCSLPLAASLLSLCAPPAPFATGYVEGEFTLVAPVAVAQVAEVAVARGDRVPAGVRLVTMESRDAEIALAEAEANLARAQSALTDLLQGARPEEIRVIEANLSAARARLAEATRQRDRLIGLADRGVASDAQRDDAETAVQVAEASVAQIEAQLSVARLPARPNAIAQAQASVHAAEAARDRADWALGQRALRLSMPVTVVDVIRQPGEIAGPSAPVLSVLGDGAVKLRLYVPEPSFARIHVGDMLQVHCDGCAPGITARITYISDEPEFTPPVIYSLENRQTLVYLVEAAPVGGDLKPGQIVDVALPGDPASGAME